MSNYTLRLSIEQYELDASDEEYNPKEYIILQDFDYRDSKDIPVESVDLWRTVVMDRPERVVHAVHIYSDEAISIRINGTGEISNTQDMILKADITKIELKNTSGTEATVTVEMWN